MTGWAALHHAANRGDVKQVEELLKLDTRVDALNRQWLPPFVTALEHEHFDVMLLLYLKRLVKVKGKLIACYAINMSD